MSTPTRAPRLLATTLLLGVALTGHAFAHAHLKSATPPVGGTVATPPSELDLTFSEGLEVKFTGVKLTGADKRPVPVGGASLKAGGDTVLVVPVPAPLPAGTYTVAWHALSTDGHKTNGTYTFTVKP